MSIQKERERLENELLKARQHVLALKEQLDELRRCEAHEKAAREARRIVDAYTLNGFTEEEAWDILKMRLKANE